MVTLPSTVMTVTEPMVTRGARASVLELLLPAGTARELRVLGSNCPLSLQRRGDDAGGRARADETVDLCILAPSPDECRRQGWLAKAAHQAATMLAPGGLVYVLAAPRWRLTILRNLGRYGFHLEHAFLHQPDWTTSRYLVPLQPETLAFVYGGLIPVRQWRRRLALRAASLAGWHQLAPLLLPSIGLVTRRSGVRPLFDWLAQAGPAEGLSSVALGSSWRGYGPVVLYSFDAGADGPATIAKTALGATESIALRREAENLKRLGDGARAAGAAVPVLLGLRDVAGGLAVVETALEGRPAAQVLEARPGEIAAVLSGLTGWLQRWHALTAARMPLTGVDLEASIIRPWAALVPDMAAGNAFRDQLAALSASVAGLVVPRVATHGDLTMANVLVEARHGLGVVDWEAAQAAWLPMTDFYYAAADAAAAAHGYADRPAAFNSCFGRAGAYTGLIVLLARRLSASLNLTPAAVDLCFYATWLEHAVREQATSRTGDPRPFRAILDRVAAQAVDINGDSLVWQ